MVREHIEYISLSAKEEVLVSEFKNMLSNYLSDIEKEDAFPTLSDTYLDVQHLLEVLNVFIRKNIR